MEPSTLIPLVLVIAVVAYIVFKKKNNITSADAVDTPDITVSTGKQFVTGKPIDNKNQVLK